MCHQEIRISFKKLVHYVAGRMERGVGLTVQGWKKKTVTHLYNAIHRGPITPFKTVFYDFLCSFTDLHVPRTLHGSRKRSASKPVCWWLITLKFRLSAVSFLCN